MTAQPPEPHPGLSFRGFIVMVAAIQTVVALAIDMMIPALGQIAQAMHLGDGNARQWVITSFVLGFGAAQLLFALAADSFGRRPILIASLALYSLASLMAAFAPSFAWLIAARVTAGIGAAGAQVLTTAVVRDCYAGRRMARVASLSFMVFLAAPIIAPSLGQAVLLTAPWPAIFIGLGLYGALITALVARRLPETQHEGDRRAVSWPEFRAALHLTLGNRVSLGYTLAGMLLLGAWLGFINSAQQVFAEVFAVPKLFPIIFAACAACMAAAALLNARLVDRLGMRRLAHAALCGFIVTASAQLLAAIGGHDGLLTFAVIQAGMMFCFGLFSGNCGAIAMEPLGHVAGTAAAVQGFINMLGAALIGVGVGQLFDGTLTPLAVGFGLCGAACLAVVAVTERGRLFGAQAMLNRQP